LVVLDIDEGAISNGDDARSRVTAGLTKGFYLFKIYVVHACPFPEDPIGCLVEVFVVVDEVTEEAPFVLVLLEVRLDEEDFQFVVIESKNDTVHRYPDNAFALQLFEDGLDILLDTGGVFGCSALTR
jgi:hypothetical protein